MAKQPLGSTAATRTSGEDVHWVEQARCGDMGAFSRLVVKYQDRILNTCWRLTGNLDDAQDLTQEAFLHALQSLDKFRQRASFYTWLFRIAVNLSISHRRKSARAVKLSLHGPDGEDRGDHQAARRVGRASGEVDDPPTRLASREIQRLVVEGLDRLDDDYRTVVVLRDIEGFDYRQIAEILDVPVGTVKSRLHRARMELRDRLEPMVSAGAARRGG